MNLRSEIFPQLENLKVIFLARAKYWKNKRCLFSEEVYRHSAKKIATIINHHKDDDVVINIMQAIENELILNEQNAVFPQGKDESLELANRVFGLLPKGNALQLLLFIAEHK